MPVLEACQISKNLKGSQVLKDINLKLEGGNVYAFQGENGSGKSMLFRVLSGLSQPSEGSVCYDGCDIHRPHKQRIKIGIVLENASLFPQFTARENLRYLARINKLVGDEEIDHALGRVGLDPDDKRTVRKYSLGMRQRLLIAQSIMEGPDFLFLDEPTNAIDKEGVALVHAIVREETARGALVMLASHIDRDISHLADICYHMSRGEIIERA